MTREEAIAYLNTLYMALAVFPNQQISLGNVDKMKESVDMAIKALKQEPCEDAISRAYIEPIVEELENICINGDEHILSLLSNIKNAPPIIPQPKTGHWIIIDDCEQFIAKCSECGRIEDSRMISKYPYCHCGAKMIENKAEEFDNLEEMLEDLWNATVEDLCNDTESEG